ncbi:MAG: isoleucine--tRNA ligase [Clostridiales bacterium]|jgi:isoleucyl-tRNA synthetase|nr:isoleucine--tRNA ligase [Clostridiales bacterium]
MSIYKKIDNSMNFVAREQDVIRFWRENGIFEKSIKNTEGGREFCFYDGPPTANGMPHIGHVLTRAMKDLIPRYKTMKGYHVLRKAGWDTHGLPVELEVEKQLKLDGKQDIERYGVEPFIAECKKSVWKYSNEWREMTERVGFWVDMDDPYVTYSDNYIESVWWSLKQMFDKGLIYKGHKIVPYCPRCGTALSSHEVAQGYKDVKEKSAVAKFGVVGEQDTYILAWTTTPWTLPSNVALCVNPKIQYSYIEADGITYILADALVAKHFTDYRLIKTVPGAQLEGIRYKPLYEYAVGSFRQDAFYVTCDSFVTTSDGTGVVHIAPAFGEDDSKVGKKYGLPFVQLVNERGRFVAGTGALEGLFAKDADKVILADLKERGLLYAALMYEHSYPHCWRCDTPLLYYARSSWFIRMTEVKKKLLKNNKTVNWLPKSIGEGRFGDFLANVIDWGFSRERYWGTPLPAWICADCGHVHFIGSKDELRTRGGLTEDIELHKPYVDGVVIKCDKCGGDAFRTPEVIDCWYDSGSMPFAQWHYPFENKELFEKTFPADFISEAVDQTRGWFYTLMAISTILFDRSPFRNCLVLGHVGDKDGVKMSKHKGNGVDPKTVLSKQGADAVRWYFYSGSAPWLPSRFYDEAIGDVQRQFMGTLWNTLSFFLLYADIDNYNPADYTLSKCRLTVMDRWALSELNSLVRTVDGELAAYRITESARAIQDFTDALSNWYVRRCRERFWGSGMDGDKAAAYTTLYRVLITLAKLCAPYVPFLAESVYRALNAPAQKGGRESVHLCKFPRAAAKYIDKELESGMRIVRTASELGHAIRNSVGIKNRQPLSRMYLALGGGVLSDEMACIAASELNVKSVEVVKDAEGFVSYELKPQLKTLGPKYGAKLGAVKNLLAASANEIIRAVRNGGVYRTVAEDAEIELTEADLLVSVKSLEGFDSASDKGVTVILDTALGEELLLEGYARELISKIQAMRKDAGFVVTDHIAVSYVTDSDKLLAALKAQSGVIASAVLADKLINGAAEDGGFTAEKDISGESITLGVKRV